MKRFIWLLIPLAISCKKEYLLNKFEIKGFEIHKGWGYTNVGIVRFKVAYYSDSTQWNSFASVREKGQNGSDQIIKYFGKANPGATRFEGCSFLPVDTFISSFNSMKNEYSGEQITREYTLCFPYQLNEQNSETILIMQDKKFGNTDTLHFSLRN
jgi:hypothetical protein